jgi:metal-dependent hydrolase (beta-lactamase superfamily II)
MLSKIRGMAGAFHASISKNLKEVRLYRNRTEPWCLRPVHCVAIWALAALRGKSKMEKRIRTEGQNG